MRALKAAMWSYMHVDVCAPELTHPALAPCMAQLALFYAAHAAHPAVTGRMKSAWEAVAAHWAWYGRVEVEELRGNTNNLAERCFGLLKYTDLARKAQSSIQQLVDTLLTKTVPRNMQNRALMLAGRTVSDQQRAEQRIAKAVEGLVATGAVKDVKELGRATVQCGSSNVHVCIGDLSCTCSYSGEEGRVQGQGGLGHPGWPHSFV